MNIKELETLAFIHSLILTAFLEHICFFQPVKSGRGNLCNHEGMYTLSEIFHNFSGRAKDELVLRRIRGNTGAIHMKTNIFILYVEICLSLEFEDAIYVPGYYREWN